VDISGKVVQAAIGSTFLNVLTEDGNVWNMGANFNYQLGDGTTTQSAFPLQVDLNGERIVQISAGTVSFALTVKGQVYAWGQSSAYGEWGDGTTNAKTTPVLIDYSSTIGNKTISRIFNSDMKTILLTEDDELYSFGYNGDAFLLGVGQSASSKIPLPMKVGNTKGSLIDFSSLSLMYAECGSGYSGRQCNSVRIRSGTSVVYEDTAGSAWNGDFGSNQGDIKTYPDQAIDEASDPRIYLSEREFCDTDSSEYSFTVDNGVYEIKLHFVELDFFGPGFRVFNISVNDAGPFVVDIFFQVGRSTALIITRKLQVEDGIIRIVFNRMTGCPKISAIEIAPTCPMHCNKCLNNKYCSECQDGYDLTGFTCKALCASNCYGRGECIGEDVCRCYEPEKYTSSNCSIPLCSSVRSDDQAVCSGHGTCVDYNNCVCSSDYSGLNCSTPNCFGVSPSSGACSGRGDCIGLNECRCIEGYYGSQCEHAVCFDVDGTDPYVCSGHGKCIDYDVCSCNANYTGAQCGLTFCSGVRSDSAMVCNGRGKCTAGSGGIGIDVIIGGGGGGADVTIGGGGGTTDLVVVGGDNVFEATLFLF
jgi:hypothetical protein